MKISILTFSKETNFGANLQCYALQKVLKDWGHSVNIIDIQLKRYTMPWYSVILRIPMVWLFQRFRKQHLNCFTKSYRSVIDLINHCPQSDLYIVGSDQVWNPRITKRLDPLVYFFSFLPQHAKRISYAASFGTEKWGFPELTPKIKPLLDQFYAISVREDTGINICKDTFGVNAIQVLDPTLLLSSYNDICGQYDKSKEKKELIYYTFKHDTHIQKVLANFAKAHNLQAVVLRSNRPYPNFKIRYYVSVKNWLNSIRYSQIIVTTSFHCMVFCILFHKKFVVVPGKRAIGTRMDSLATYLGLSSFLCHKIENLYQVLEKALTVVIDYNEIDKKIEKRRKESLSFLRESCKF